MWLLLRTSAPTELKNAKIYFLIFGGFPKSLGRSRGAGDGGYNGSVRGGYMSVIHVNVTYFLSAGPPDSFSLQTVSLAVMAWLWMANTSIHMTPETKRKDNS